LLGPALWLNDLLSIQRNRGVATHRHLGRGELISAASLPGRWLGERRGLCARWFDAFAPDISRLVIETLHWACEHGAIALNYVEVESLVVGDHAGGARVEGVRARDSATGETLEVRAPVVMNAAGPWSREFARGRGPDHPELFVPSLAWNVLFDRPAPPGFAIAASPPARDGRVYFAVPWKGRLLVGTGHEPWLGSVEEPAPSVAQLEAFVRDLNRAIPGLELGLSDVLRVHAGLLPARSPGSSVLTSREVLIDHSRDGGPDGFFSLSGIKFTTARRVADKALKAAFPRAEARPYEHLARPAQDALNDPGWDWWPDDEQSQWLDALRPLLRQESVLHLDDLMLRRTWLADNPHRARRLAHRVCSLFDWDVARRKLEVQRVIASLARGAPIPLTAPVESRRDCELPGMVFRCS
jgi:glycerol-3-phosphate dehydrogenase